jgi:protein TonB
MREVSEMKKEVTVLDLKQASVVYGRYALLASVLGFILLFYLFPAYHIVPPTLKKSVESIIVEPPDPLLNPVVPKAISKPSIPVPTEDPKEIENVLIPPDSTLFERFGQEDPNAIPDPGTFIAVERYPSLIYGPPPEYPDIARAAGIEGKVFLQIFVGKDGKPRKIIVVKSDVTEDCNSAAVDAAWTYRFEPAMQRDKPVGVWVSMPITFKLK